MHRLSVMAGIFGAALLMSSAAFAQVPADPNNPNEAVPDAMTQPPYGETINIETAKKAAAAAVASREAELEWSLRGNRRALRRPRLFRKAGQLPIRFSHDFATQGTHRGPLSASDTGF